MPSVLVIDDDAAMGHVFRRFFEDSEINVLTAGSASEGLDLIRHNKPDVTIVDIVLPDGSGLETFQRIQKLDAKMPVVFITAGGTSDTAIEAMKLGAFDYLLKPLDFPKVQALLDQAFEIRRLMNVPVRLLQTNTNAATSSDCLIGRCTAIQDVYKAIGRVAPQNVTVLIRGESGTGKELVARAIYQHSTRASGRFMAVNCAAIPETLLESELFGHEKGSFTGADNRRIGKFEQCSGGTLFLDEVGDMTPLVQSKMLRVLQDQRFERVGGNESIKTDVRIITATNRDLEEMVEEGKFRPDLFYRLNGFTIKLPALRERSDDILLLLEHFLGRFNRELGRNVCDISPDALDLLMQYSWPGNVRELQAVVKQALLQATGPVLMPEFFPEEVRAGGRSGSLAGASADVGRCTEFESYIDKQLRGGSEDLYAEALAHMERMLLTRVLRHTDGNQSKAAKILGITRGSLRNKIRTLRITIDQVVGVEETASSDEAEATELTSVN
jgi:two-component system nitrogen regulation response regulator GlnG